jgi:hypothetical protein
LSNYAAQKGLILKYEQSESDKGDFCHYDIKGFKDKRDSVADSFEKDFCKPPNIFICENGQPRNITDDEHLNLCALKELNSNQ